jgi:hypothetical protein
LKIDAEFTITSKPGQGARIEIVVPCKSREAQGAMQNGKAIQ